MKYRKFILLIGVLIVFVGCSHDDNTQGINLSIHPKEDIPDFNIVYPEATGEYERINTEIPNPLLEGDTITNWILQGKDENGPYMYFVAHNRISNNKSNELESDTSKRDLFFKHTLIHSSKKLGGENFDFRRVRLADSYGLESHCKVFEGKGVIVSRIFIFGHHIFVLGGGGRGVEEEKVFEFLNSFETDG